MEVELLKIRNFSGYIFKYFHFNNNFLKINNKKDQFPDCISILRA